MLSMCKLSFTSQLRDKVKKQPPRSPPSLSSPARLMIKGAGLALETDRGGYERGSAPGRCRIINPILEGECAENKVTVPFLAGTW